MNFPTEHSAILERMTNIDPESYVQNRNYIDGSVSYLSPYISRGVISTKQVFTSLIERGFDLRKIEKFVQELAWRDYWQQVWIAKGDLIDQDLKSPQLDVNNYGIAEGIIRANTGIKAIDSGIQSLYQTGYMHNHVRMYTASLACNIAKSHWKVPAQWMYYHLLDADWASNALSWQWVVGTNSSKKYFANQENINKFCYSEQSNTYLDHGYDQFPLREVPKELAQIDHNQTWTTWLPKSDQLRISAEKPTLIYTFYNMDLNWHPNEVVNRVLLLEPSHFKKYPVSDKTIHFLLSIAQNIPDLQLFVGEFNELLSSYSLKNIRFKEHPTNNHFTGIEEPRDWIFPVEGDYPSFFAYWKKCKSYLG